MAALALDVLDHGRVLHVSNLPSQTDLGFLEEVLRSNAPDVIESVHINRSHKGRKPRAPSPSLLVVCRSPKASKTLMSLSNKLQLTSHSRKRLRISRASVHTIAANSTRGMGRAHQSPGEQELSYSVTSSENSDVAMVDAFPASPDRDEDMDALTPGLSPMHGTAAPSCCDSQVALLTPAASPSPSAPHEEPAETPTQASIQETPTDDAAAQYKTEDEQAAELEEQIALAAVAESVQRSSIADRERWFGEDLLFGALPQWFVEEALEDFYSRADRAQQELEETPGYPEAQYQAFLDASKRI